MHLTRTTAAVAVPLLLTAACSTDAPESRPPGEHAGVPAGLEVALSTPQPDSVYPQVGSDVVDALHYDLELAWDPDDDVLTGRETLTFRAAKDSRRIPLDLSDAFAVQMLTVDGEEARHRLAGDDLVIDHTVEEDQVYEVVIAYRGTPRPAEAPTQRDDITGLGWTITDDHEAWTMQEPFGAFTWYAVNDHPSDKALYDFRLTGPRDWTGVANGELTGNKVARGRRTTTWHLAEPAAAYLVTATFGDYRVTRMRSRSGIPITVWGPADLDGPPGETGTAADAMDWLEQKLGPYPFDTFGIVVIDGDSGMETQTMVTLGNNEYATSAEVVVHELVHHWYGDTVTPSDWRDMWMNEGMAMYLQIIWMAENEGIELETLLTNLAPDEAEIRAEAGPPGDYDPDHFGAANVYYGPALMWHELRERIGDRRFWAMVRDWPAAMENTATDRVTYLAWIEEETGEELSRFFKAWLMGATTPPRA